MYTCNSVLGALFIILGLYCVVWGKSTEVEKTTELDALIKSSKESELRDTAAVEAQFDDPRQLP